MPIVDTSGNTVSATGSFTFVLTESDLLYRSLIKPIRDLDRGEGGLFVKRFLERPQKWVDDTAERIHGLSETDDPATIREDLLKYLKDHVGLTIELSSIVDRLSTENLRKLITLAVPLWSKKGTSDGLETIVRLLTGRTPVYFDWFYFRNVLAETQIGEDLLGNDNWIIGGEVSLNDEFTSHLRLMDDGTLDEQLLLDLLSLFRPTGERLEVALLDHLDQFDQNLDRWTTATGYSSPGTLDADNKEMVLAAGQGMRPIIPRFPTPAEQFDVAVSYKFKLDSATSEHVFDVCFIDANNKLTWTLKSGSPEFTLELWVGGVLIGSGTLAANPYFDIIPDVWYALRIETFNDVTYGTIMRLFLDGCNIFGDLPTDPFNGTVQLGSKAGGGEVRIDNFEAHCGKLRFATIGPDGPVVTDNFID